LVALSRGKYGDHENNTDEKNLHKVTGLVTVYP